MSDVQFTRGEGGRCWDASGCEYIDLVCGYGPVILGHAHPEVTAAVSAQAHEGNLLPGPTVLQQRLADSVRGLLPHTDEILPFKTGSEAVAAALRLARAHTGARTVIRAGFHGWHDQVVSPYLACHRYDWQGVAPEYPPGVPHDLMREDVLTWIGPSLKRLAAMIEASVGTLAAVILDPVHLTPPFTEAATRIMKATRAAGGLFIMDESKTGCRVHDAGFQGRYGIEADLTILSKALANGYPLALVAGPEELIAHAKAARIKGTYGQELGSIAASLTTLGVLRQESAPARLEECGQELIDRLNSTFRSIGVDNCVTAIPYRWAAMPHLLFAPNQQSQRLQAEFFPRLADAGVLMLKKHMSFISLAHGEDDIRVVEATVASVMQALARGE